MSLILNVLSAESYTQRDVRLHVQRLKDLLSTNPLQQSMLSSDGLSLSFLSSIALLDTDGIGLDSIPIHLDFYSHSQRYAVWAWVMTS